jgi:ATP-dependent DNA helicase PIF1
MYYNKIISTNIYITLSKGTLQHKYTYEAYYYKTSFPTVLAYAITGHKAQGATITSKIFVHIRESFV